MSPRGAGEESERGGLLRDDAVSEVDTDTLGASDGVVFSLLKGVEKSEKEAKIHEKKRVDTNGGELAPKATGNVEVPEVDHKNSSSRKKDQASDSQEEIDPTKAGRSNLVDNWTQTEEEYFITAPNASLPHLQNGTSPLSKTSTPSQLKASQANPRLPQVGLGQSANYVANPGQDRLQPQSRLNLEPMVERQSSQKLLAASQMVKFPSAKRPLSALVDSLPTYSAIVNPNHVRSYSADANLCSNSSRQVRTGEATKRLMGLYNGFNRTEVQRRFHEQYPQKAPDLREYSVREGRRHIIHGSHAYYFH